MLYHIAGLYVELEGVGVHDRCFPRRAMHVLNNREL